MRKLPLRRLLAVILSLTLLGGCARLALRLNPSLLENLKGSLFEECDPEFAKEAIPANLKILEGLLKSDPGNKRILTTLSMGFGGYALLFVESEDPARASQFYLRARDYGVSALAGRGKVLSDPEAREKEVQEGLQGMDKDDLEALFWTTFAWNAWISLNLDKPAALAQLGASQACLKKVLERDSTYFHGLPHIMEGVMLAVRSPMFGGDVAQAQSRFQKALEISHRQFFLAQYYCAGTYAVRAQDKELFRSLVHEIIHGDAQALREVCLINTVIQRKAKILEQQMSELFD
jgi:hypothetical protein